MDLSSVVFMTIMTAGVVVATVSARVLTLMRPAAVPQEGDADPLLAMSVINAGMFVMWIVVVYQLAGIMIACLVAAAGLVLLVPSDLPILARRLVRRFGLGGFGRLSLALDALVTLLAMAVYVTVVGGAGA